MHTYTLTLAAVLSCYSWNGPLCWSRGREQEKMKAPRQQASWHYRLSVNSSQASVKQMRVEFGWRAFLKSGNQSWSWKKSLCAWEILTWKERRPTNPLIEDGYVCVCVYLNMAAQFCGFFCGRTKACHLNGSWHSYGGAHSRALDYHRWRLRPPSIYQARQLFNMKSNKRKVKCQEAGGESLAKCPVQG